MTSKLYIYLPIIFLFLLLFCFQSPGLIKTIFVYSLIFILSLSSVFFLLKDQLRKQWPFLVEIIVFVLSAEMFFIFLVNEFWQYFFIFIFCLFFGLLFKYIYTYLFQPRLYSRYGMENTGLVLNFMISYWSLSGLSGFIGWNPFWWPSIASFILVFILFFWLNYYIGWTAQAGRVLTSLVAGLVLSELYLVVRFLPLGAHFNALVVSILYVIILLLYRNFKNIFKILNSDTSPL